MIRVVAACGLRPFAPDLPADLWPLTSGSA
jgi:hypothetical protein